MKVTCDHCDRTASGLRDDLQEAGWCRAFMRASICGTTIRQTFTGCPDHAMDALRAAVMTLDDAFKEADRDEPDRKKSKIIGFLDDLNTMPKIVKEVDA